MYIPSRPSKLKGRAVKIKLKSILKTACYLFSHTLALHESETGQKDVISTTNPEGKFDSEHLHFAESALERANTRNTAVERKATILLATLGVLSPLLFSIVQLPAQVTAYSTALTYFFITCFSVAGLFILLSFIACFKALNFHQYRVVGINFLLEDNAVKPISTDHLVRAKLYEAAEKNAVTDHISDFVRASQMFLMIGAILIIIGSLVAINANLLSSERSSGDLPRTIVVPVIAT